MGGELEKKTLEQHPDFQDIVKSEKNKKNKSKNKKEINETVTTDTVKSNNNVKRAGGGKKKKEKLQVVAKDKEKKVNYEKKVLELIHERNPEKEDYDIIYDIISKHFFLQTLTHQAKEEIIVSMSLYKVSKWSYFIYPGITRKFLVYSSIRRAFSSYER